MIGAKELVWAPGAEYISTPPMPIAVRRRAGYLLRMVQDGYSIGMPESRPMPSVGAGCHELRLSADRTEWRVIYYLDVDVVLVLGVFKKTTRRTPRQLIETFARRLRLFHET
ncbi:MAG TPA: type II toxin-antitoxin system RelE/ParE family toxin [Thermoanaerobaculia bacterium]|nr:type II toxin-antitoxin system RelE/ParE family toxin [Thermoanaerobaculia bacterium]